jgi:hypothetical protein
MHHIYWPDSGSTTIEHNIYLRSSAPPKGEEDNLVILNAGSEQPANPQPSPPKPLNNTVLDDGHAPNTPEPAPATDLPPPALHRSTCNWKPSCLMYDLQSGIGVTDTDTTCGLQLHNPLAEDAKEPGGVWSIKDRSSSLLEDFNRLKHVFMVEMAESEVPEHRTLAEAKCRPNWLLWEKAIKEELATLKATSTWRLEEAPPRANVIGFIWVFKAKKDAMGNITCYKACLVTQGFSQIGGINYDDTYAPVAKLALSHAIITMANCLGLELYQINIKGAYLNGVLGPSKVLFMYHAPGYKSLNTGTCILCLIIAVNKRVDYCGNSQKVCIKMI